MREPSPAAKSDKDSHDRHAAAPREAHVALPAPLPPPPPPSENTSFPVALVIASSALFASSNAYLRLATTTHAVAPVFVVFLRGALQLAVTAPLLLALSARGTILCAKSRRTAVLQLLLRGCVGAASIVLKDTTLSLLPAGVASSLFALNPLFASLLGWLLLRAALSPAEPVALVVSAFGSVLVGTASSGQSLERHRDTVHGMPLALLTAVSTAAVYVATRWIGTAVHFLLVVLVHSMCCMMAAAIVWCVQTGAGWNDAVSFFLHTLLSSSGDAKMAFVASCVLGMLGAFCVNCGNQRLPPGRAALLRTLDIPLNFAFAFLILGEFPTSPQEILGCVLMASSSYLVASRKAS